MSASPTPTRLTDPDSGLLPVSDALERILAAVSEVGTETVAIDQAQGRVAAEDLKAQLTHPPEAVSAMDGYALRSADVGALPVRLKKLGVSRAGGRFEGALTAGGCVRIFTGAVVPRGADLIALQEDASEDGEEVVIREVPPKGRYIRPAGLDFSTGQVVVPIGRVLTARDLGLLASSGHGEVAVRRRPRVAILSTGDELVAPGQAPGPDQIVSSNGVALAAAVRGWGGEALELGIAADETAAIADAADRARGADMLVTSGGASAGDHDLVRAGISERGFAPDFWRIAMRPGKPLMFGWIGDMPVLGVPGNPVSAVVCAVLFLRPALRKMLGLPPAGPLETAILGAPMRENDRREEYARARLQRDGEGRLVALPFDAQDSSMQMRLSQADALIRRPVRAPAAAAGETVEIIRLDIGEPLV